MSLAPSRPPDRRFRTATWRRRAGSEQRQASPHVGTVPGSSARSFVLRWSKSLQEQLETFRHLLLADFVEAILEPPAEHGQNGAVETSARLRLAGIVRHLH